MITLPRVAVHLYFDPDSDQAVRRIWAALADVAPYTSQSGHHPHISLAIYENFAADTAEKRLKQIASQTAAFPLTLSHWGIFPGEGPVVLAAPTMTVSLLNLHQRTHQALDDLADVAWQYYIADHWVPHCTLAMNFPQQQLSNVLEICRQLPLPLPIQITHIGLVELRPVRDLGTFALQSP